MMQSHGIGNLKEGTSIGANCEELVGGDQDAATQWTGQVSTSGGSAEAKGISSGSASQCSKNMPSQQGYQESTRFLQCQRLCLPVAHLQAQQLQLQPESPAPSCRQSAGSKANERAVPDGDRDPVFRQRSRGLSKPRRASRPRSTGGRKNGGHTSAGTKVR